MPRSVLTAAGGLLLAAVAALSLTTAPEPAGAAASRCAGTLIESQAMVVNKKKVGELDVFYNRATGRNCARMNHAGPTWGLECD